MFPNFKNRDLILVQKKGFIQNIPHLNLDLKVGETELKRLDVVLFQDEKDQELVKRLIGLPGDFYSFRENKIYIDSVDYDAKKNILAVTTPPSELISAEAILDFFPMKAKGRIPPDYFLLLGDNRENSTDSRTYGLVPYKRLRGKVVKVIF
jgi:signal peptidase I